MADILAIPLAIRRSSFLYMGVKITFTVNAAVQSLDLDSATPLIFALRNDFAMHGAKLGCGLEQCGSCVVLIDGKPTYSCTTPVGDLEGKRVETLEGLAGEDGALHPLQAAFLELNAAQCGYCTAGIVMRAKALLMDNPNPSRDEICVALDGHLCRCGAHPRIVRAVQNAAAKLRASDP